MIALEPYRPVFTVLTLLLLSTGFYLTYRKHPTNAGDCGCEMPATHRTGKRLLWAATALVFASLLFPYATPYLF